jgi:hypothetical protein
LPVRINYHIHHLEITLAPPAKYIIAQRPFAVPTTNVQESDHFQALRDRYVEHFILFHSDFHFQAHFIFEQSAGSAPFTRRPPELRNLIVGYSLYALTLFSFANTYT